MAKDEIEQFADVTAHKNSPITAVIQLPRHIGEGTVVTTTIRETLTIVVTDIQLAHD